MKTYSGIRLAAVLAAVVLAGSIETATAQEREQVVVRSRNGQEVTVRLKDGKVFVNDREMTPDADGRIVFEDENGEEVTVHVSRRGDRSMVWFGDEDEPGEYGIRSPRRFGLWLDDDDDRGRAFAFADDLTSDSLLRRFRLHAPSIDFDRNGLRAYADGLRDKASEFARQAEETARLRADLSGKLVEDLMVERPFVGALFERNEELRRLEDEIRELARRVRRAGEAERAGLETELDRKLSEAFDVKEADALEEARRLEERLQELRARQAERATAREQIIERRKRALLGERDALDW